MKTFHFAFKLRFFDRPGKRIRRKIRAATWKEAHGIAQRDIKEEFSEVESIKLISTEILTGNSQHRDYRDR